MSYEIVLTKIAQNDLNKLKKIGNKSILKKLNLLFNELRENPYSGTGKIEQLKYYEIPTYSRRINKEHRMVYRVDNNKIIVLVLSCYGHYLD
jgi:toxin YoeB